MLIVAFDILVDFDKEKLQRMREMAKKLSQQMMAAKKAKTKDSQEKLSQPESKKRKVEDSSVASDIDSPSTSQVPATTNTQELIAEGTTDGQHLVPITKEEGQSPENSECSALVEVIEEGTSTAVEESRTERQSNGSSQPATNADELHDSHKRRHKHKKSGKDRKKRRDRSASMYTKSSHFTFTTDQAIEFTQSGLNTRIRYIYSSCFVAWYRVRG